MYVAARPSVHARMYACTLTHVRRMQMRRFGPVESPKHRVATPRKTKKEKERKKKGKKRKKKSPERARENGKRMLAAPHERIAYAEGRSDRPTR